MFGAGAEVLLRIARLVAVPDHFGAGDFFEREAERVDDDRGLSEDAG